MQGRGRIPQLDKGFVDIIGHLILPWGAEQRGLSSVPFDPDLPQQTWPNFFFGQWSISEEVGADLLVKAGNASLRLLGMTKSNIPNDCASNVNTSKQFTKC